MLHNKFFFFNRIKLYSCTVNSIFLAWCKMQMWFSSSCTRLIVFFRVYFLLFIFVLQYISCLFLLFTFHHSLLFWEIRDYSGWATCIIQNGRQQNITSSMLGNGKRKPGRTTKSWNDTMTEDFYSIEITGHDFAEIADGQPFHFMCCSARKR